MQFLTVLAACLAFPAGSFANTICNAYGLGYEIEEFSFLICEGDLDHQTAVDCVNKIARDAAIQEARSKAAQEQAECLCRAVNEAVSGSGRYNWLTGQCTVGP